ncbi:MAG: TRAP transporter substrate-binding protein [Proteobacteria bacterium]|nr:TRAP transporter substrate-binding protein [Pseudomonadota bacterium]
MSKIRYRTLYSSALSCFGALALGGALAASAAAAELPRTHVKVIGAYSTIVASFKVEIPFWKETIPKDSNGMVTADITPQDQLGIDDKTMLRLLKLGVMDFAEMDISKMAGDDPHFEGCDLAGVSLDLKKARAGCDAYRAVLDGLMQKNWNAKLLAFGTNPPQVFWCRVPIAGLADLKGKKVRVFNKTMIDFLNGVGATAVNMAFAEVVPALQRGVVDCGVTGTLSGNTAGWPEVTTHLYPMSLGWSIQVYAANLNSWNRLNPAVQAFFVREYKKFEDALWATGAEAIADAENCNFGKQPCKMGKPAKLTQVPVSAADGDMHKKLIETAVLKGWASRCGGACAKEWNETVGKTLGYTAPVN